MVTNPLMIQLNNRGHKSEIMEVPDLRIKGMNQCPAFIPMTTDCFQVDEGR